METKSEIPPHTEYVVGFIFSIDFSRVLLVKKLRPAWQAGLLNGIGGKVEPGEDPLHAMVRECKEESGLEISAWSWKPVAIIQNPYARVHVYSTNIDYLAPANVPETNDVGEKLRVTDVLDLYALETIRNLNFLIPLCANFESAMGGTKICKPVVIEEGDA
jgi:8-oxo-dGTP diphosphatase